MIAFIVAIWKVTTGDDDGDDLLGVDCDKEDTLNAAQKTGTHLTQEKSNASTVYSKRNANLIPNFFVAPLGKGGHKEIWN